VTYLQPLPAPAPLQGQDLNRFIQQWFAGVIGAGSLDPTLIRPYDQGEPPVIPPDGTAWMAFSQRTEDSDTYPSVVINQDGSGATLQRHEQIAVLCSFYDLGTNGQAANLASLLRDGLSIPDNLETLTLADFAIVGCEPEVVVPSLLKERWLYRVDLPLKLRRQVTRVYAVQDIASANGTIVNDVNSIVQQINVYNP
jgi:hypothetical protein